MSEPLICTCCERAITPATYDAGHTYRLPVYEPVTWQGQPAALRIGWRRVAVCGPCVARIHAAADRRVGLPVTRAAIEVHSA